MKRSEVIKLIYYSFKNAEAGDSLDSAEYVLENLEAIGMLPPSVKGTHGFLCDEYGMVNEWEEE